MSRDEEEIRFRIKLHEESAAYFSQHIYNFRLGQELNVYKKRPKERQRGRERERGGGRSLPSHEVGGPRGILPR